MLLRDYLVRNGERLYAFADRIEVDRSTLYRHGSGSRRISATVAIKIEEATEGQVTRMEAMFPEMYAEKNEDGSEQYKLRYE